MEDGEGQESLLHYVFTKHYKILFKNQSLDHQRMKLTQTIAGCLTRTA